jgi:hypothetical protein
MTTPAPDHLPTARELENVYADGLCASDWPMLNEEAAKHRRRASALERRASSENRQLLADESRTARAHTSEAAPPFLLQARSTSLRRTDNDDPCP